MPNYHRVKIPGASYFFTVVTERRQKILTAPRMREALHNAMVVVRAEHTFVIDALVLMPDHLHCIWTLPENDADYSIRWAKIKKLVTKEIGSEYFRESFLTERRAKKHQGTIWQQRFWEHRLRDDSDYCKHMDYLHFNPVKHGLVQSVKDWPWSSFHRLVKEGIYSENWGDNEILNFEIPSKFD